MHATHTPHLPSFLSAVLALLWTTHDNTQRRRMKREVAETTARSLATKATLVEVTSYSRSSSFPTPSLRCDV